MQIISYFIFIYKIFFKKTIIKLLELGYDNLVINFYFYRCKKRNIFALLQSYKIKNLYSKDIEAV